MGAASGRQSEHTQLVIIRIIIMIIVTKIVVDNIEEIYRMFTYNIPMGIDKSTI